MKKKTVLSLLKGITVAFLITVLGIALIALLAKNDGTDGGVITLLLIILKIVSIAVGTFISLKGIRKSGAVVGGTLATVYRILCFALSALTVDKNVFVFSSLTELFFSAVIGIIAGAILINTVKR